MFLQSGSATELVALSRRGRGICHMAAARASHLSHSLHRVATSRKPCPAGCSMAISTTVCTGSSQAVSIAGIQGRAVVMLVLSKLHADSVRAKDAMRLPLPRAKGSFFWGSSRSLVRCNCWQVGRTEVPAFATRWTCEQAVSTTLFRGLPQAMLAPEVVL